MDVIVTHSFLPVLKHNCHRLSLPGKCVEHINALRSLHKDTAPLTLDKRLTDHAQKMAERLAKKGATFAHDKNDLTGK